MTSIAFAKSDTNMAGTIGAIFFLPRRLRFNKRIPATLIAYEITLKILIHGSLFGGSGRSTPRPATERI